jgi:hypothetical protein
MRICLIIILVILLVWNIKMYLEFPERLTVSIIDGKEYTVKKQYKNHQKASDILAKLNYVNNTVIAHMQKKYTNSSEIDVDFLVKNYNGDVLSEHTPRTTVNTSYVLNKGDLIKLCLRNKETGEFHDMNTLIFVNLHELSHLLDREYGHKKSFWRGFQTVLKEAVELGFYKPINYSKNPANYCGLQINSNPFFRPYNTYL